MSLNASVDQTPAYCRCGKFGSPEEPKKLIQVRMHNRHCKLPGAPHPPIIQADDGTWVESVPAHKLQTKVEPAHRAPAPSVTPPAPTGPPDPPPPPLPDWATAPGGPFAGAEPPAGGNGNGHMPAPQLTTGRLAVPPIAPGAGQPPEPPLTPVTVRLTQSALQFYDFVRQEGYLGTIDDFVDQAIRGYFRHVRHKTVAIVDLET